MDEFLTLQEQVCGELRAKAIFAGVHVVEEDLADAEYLIDLVMEGVSLRTIVSIASGKVSRPNLSGPATEPVILVSTRENVPLNRDKSDGRTPGPTAARLCKETMQALHLWTPPICGSPLRSEGFESRQIDHVIIYECSFTGNLNLKLKADLTLAPH